MGSSHSQGCGRRLDQSEFQRPMRRGVFSRTRQPSERKRIRKEISASREWGWLQNRQKWRKRTCRATVLLIKSSVFWPNWRSRIYCLINFSTPENTTLASQDSWQEQFSLVYFVTARSICKFVEQLWGLEWLHLVPLQTHEKNVKGVAVGSLGRRLSPVSLAWSD